MSNPSLDYESDSSLAGSHDPTAHITTPTHVCEDFDFDALDSLKELVRERLENGETFEAIIHSLAREQAEDLAIERLATFIAIIRAARKPILLIDCFWMLSGAALREGATIQSLARRHGCSKQSFQQALERVQDKFKFKRKTRTARDDESKQEMKKAYFKMPKF